MAMALDSFKSPMAVGLEIPNWRMTSADETAPFACINPLMSNSFLITYTLFLLINIMYIRELIQFCQEILYAFLYAIFTLFADLPKKLNVFFFKFYALCSCL